MAPMETGHKGVEEATGAATAGATASAPSGAGAAATANGMRRKKKNHTKLQRLREARCSTGYRDEGLSPPRGGDGRVEEEGPHHSLALQVCNDEVVSVMKRLKAPEEADTDRYLDVTASLLGVGDRARQMFERADAEIDTIESNL